MPAVGAVWASAASVKTLVNSAVMDSRASTLTCTHSVANPDLFKAQLVQGAAWLHPQHLI